ncbi:hypothetical protein CDIK_4400 [Cucumispora dikerogammari]|nr:hypothetical protein CDIK_4400 [Cucumispora dikerogammari]
MTINVHMATPTREEAQESSKPNKYEIIRELRRKAEMIRALRYCQENGNETKEQKIKEVIRECSIELKQEILKSCKIDMNSFVNKKFDEIIGELKKKKQKKKRN